MYYFWFEEGAWWWSDPLVPDGMGYGPFDSFAEVVEAYCKPPRPRAPSTASEPSTTRAPVRLSKP